MNKEYDFIVGFTIFRPSGFKTMYRHFDKLETAQLFASNKNLKDNCKIYVDLDFYNDKKECTKHYLTFEEIENVIEHCVCDYDCLVEKLNEKMYPEFYEKLRNENKTEKINTY